MTKQGTLVCFFDHLEFLRTPFISEMVRDRAILTKSLTRRLSAESTGNFSQKLFSPNFLVANLNFWVKRKNVFILAIV